MDKETLSNKEKTQPKKNQQRRKRRKPRSEASLSRKKKSNLYVPMIKEPKPLCTICNTDIENIAEAIREPGEGGYSHFDCVIQKLTEQEKLAPQQKISYMGRGTFAVVVKEEGKFVTVKTIQYESPEDFLAMKMFVEESKE